MNRGYLTGRLGNDVRVTTSANKNVHARLRLAEKYFVRSEDGEGWDERVAWHTIPVFGRLAETCKILGKGSLVLVEYRLTEQVFEQGDVRITYSQPVAKTVEFLDVRKPGSSGDESDAPADDAAAEPAVSEDDAEDES